MKTFNNIHIPCEINGTTIASECGMFDHIYRNHKEKKFTYSNINLHSDGSLEINVFIPNVSKYEYEDFMSKPMRFYNKKLPNGAYQTSIRGATSMDVIFDPALYNDSRISKIPEKKMCNAFLIDTATDKILGIRAMQLNDKVYDEFYNSCSEMLKNNITLQDIIKAFTQYIIPYSHSAVLKQATYLGREVSNATPQFLYVA